MVNDRPGKRDAPGFLLLRHMVGDGQTAELVDGGSVREERSRVAVRAYAEGDKVEARALGALEAEAVAQLGLVAEAPASGSSSPSMR